MVFDDFDIQVQCEEVYDDYECGYFADHDYFWDEDSDCYIRKEFFNVKKD